MTASTALNRGARRDVAGVLVMPVKRYAPRVCMSSGPTIDGGRAADVWFDNVRIAPDALLTETGRPLIERVVDEAVIAMRRNGWHHATASTRYGGMCQPASPVR